MYNNDCSIQQAFHNETLSLDDRKPLSRRTARVQIRRNYAFTWRAALMLGLLTLTVGLSSHTAEGACTVTCPANITQSNDANQCGAVVVYPAPITSGECGTVTCTPASGSFFPVGTTTVTCTSASGDSCTFSITIVDTQPPAITCPGNITVGGASASGATVNYSAPLVSDNCPGVIVISTPPSGSVFPFGVTIITCTATDASGNTASCTFTITVTVEPADLAISQIASSANSSPGKNITYTLHAQNLGPGFASGVVISDSVPANCSFVSATGPVSSAPPPGYTGTVVWSLGGLASDANQTVTMTVKVSRKGKNSVSNTATISSLNSDPVPSNNSTTLSTALPSQGK